MTPDGEATVNPLHPGLPPDPPAEEAKENPTPEAKAGGESEGNSEGYLRNLTGGRYKSTAAVWKAKQETDNAYHQLSGEVKVLKEQLLTVQQNQQVANPPDNRLRERLEESGISPDVADVFRDLAQSVVADTLAPIAQSQENRARALAANPEWATNEAEMFQFLAQNPGEQQAFQTIYAADQEAAYKYGMRGLAEARATVDFEQATNEAIPAATEEKERALAHGQVISQKHRASEGTIMRQPGAQDRDEAEADAWERGAAVGDFAEYANQRLDFVVETHPQLKALVEEAKLHRQG